MRRVVITGAGVVSPLGDSRAALHAALCGGRSAAKPLELFGDEKLGCTLACEITDFDAQKYLGGRNLRPLDRTARLVASAARLALEDSGFGVETLAREAVGLVLGTMFGSLRTISEFDRRALTAGPTYASPMDFANTVISAAAGQTAIMHGLRGVNSTVSTGASSGLQAIAYAADLIRAGSARALLAGGAEELCFESFYGFDRAGLLCPSNNSAPVKYPIPFDARRGGFLLGEGAALLMLEDASRARERGAHVLAEVKGVGSAFDPSRGKDDGKAVAAEARAARLALEDAQLQPASIDCLSASANGSLCADRREAYAIADVFASAARKLPVTAVKSMLGETLGAAGALQVVALTETMRDGVLPGIRGLEETDGDFPPVVASPQNRRVDVSFGLVNSNGFDGHSSSLVLARPSRR
ncbi:MAG: beta-ketoacyl-[acyl-carrier-protein] synthase family protein [Acidobacteria bacterium]|nr:beta-ketoacyl-[acyl-carrier-protein] synthase family protein [Acidobacteriota bacterium]